ncbi:MAG: hypothetical protein PHE89_03765 [Alphaproteobacteria bacterium]|nr:hypothetical protein [Alphaproteobacteria bacterium]
MAKNPKTKDWNELDVLKKANQVNETFVINKIDKIGQVFQSRLLTELMANSLRIKEMAKTDPYVYNIERNTRFGGIVGLHCVAAQEQIYNKVSQELGLDFGIIPEKACGCVPLKNHLFENYSTGDFEECSKELTVHKTAKDLEVEKNKEVAIKLNKYATQFAQANGKELTTQEKNKEKHRLQKAFLSSNVLSSDITSGSLMLIRSPTNSASGLHSVFYVGEDEQGKAKHVSFNYEGLFSLFKRRKKKISLYVFDMPRITMVSMKKQADTFAKMEKVDIIKHLQSAPENSFKFSLEKLDKQTLSNFAISQYFSGLEAKARQKPQEWEMKNVVYRRNVEPNKEGVTKITLGHYLGKTKLGR